MHVRMARMLVEGRGNDVPDVVECGLGCSRIRVCNIVHLHHLGRRCRGGEGKNRSTGEERIAEEGGDNVAIDARCRQQCEVGMQYGVGKDSEDW